MNTNATTAFYADKSTGSLHRLFSVNASTPRHTSLCKAYASHRALVPARTSRTCGGAGRGRRWLSQWSRAWAILFYLKFRETNLFVLGAKKLCLRTVLVQNCECTVRLSPTHNICKLLQQRTRVKASLRGGTPPEALKLRQIFLTSKKIGQSALTRALCRKEAGKAYTFP